MSRGSWFSEAKQRNIHGRSKMKQEGTRQSPQTLTGHGTLRATVSTRPRTRHQYDWLPGVERTGSAT